MNSMRSKENRIHSSGTKPFSFYECIIPDRFNCAPMHWHSEFELNFVREGSAEFICGSEKFISNAGDIIITLPNEMHSVYPHADNRQVYDTLVFSREIFGSSDADRYIRECIAPLVNGSMRVQTHITPDHHYYNELRTSAEIIFSCARGNSPRLDMLMRSEIIRLFWLLETEAKAEIAPESSNEIIRKSLEYIAANYSDSITIKQLSDAVHLSQSYFMNQFQKHVGLSAVEYITHFRINQACRELIDTKKNVSEIAFSCGFHNLSNFNRQFRKIVGCSPKEYREKMRRLGDFTS